MKIYAIEISYGDGCTYSAEKLELFHTDKEYLQDLCDTFIILDEYKNYDFYVVEIEAADSKFTDKDINRFMEYWHLKEK